MRTKPHVLPLVVAVMMASCSGGSSAKRVSAAAYAAGVCGALQTWAVSVQNQANTLPATGGGTTPSEDKVVLRSYLERIVSNTDSLIRATEGIGVPDVNGGDDVAGSISDAFHQAKAALTEAEGKLDALPTDDRMAFDQAAAALTNSVKISLSNIAAPLSLSQPDVRAAFIADPTCSSLVSG